MSADDETEPVASSAVDPRTVLTGPDADPVNEDGEEPVVKPGESTESVESAFTYPVPANSLTVYRINR